MARVTKAQLDAAFAQYVFALKSSGLEEFANVEMREGSVSNGTSWTLTRRGTSDRPIGGGFFSHLGSNRAEAFNTLQIITQTIIDIRGARP